jgi:uroporphyrinogen-III decarboxylase
MNDWIHNNTSWKTFKHSCGAVLPLISNFIEAGFDILNPVQINATDMDSKVLKSKFGDKITFWGGGVDTQLVLSFGSPADVEKQVIQQCEVLGENGGFVFNTVHNTQANVPVDNLIAMINAVRKFNEK